MFQFLLIAAVAQPSDLRSMSSLLPIAILIGVLAVLSNLIPNKRRKRRAKAAQEEETAKPLGPGPLHFEANDIPLAYQLRPSLLTKAERSFYGVLRQVLREEWTVFAKVRVSDIVTGAAWSCGMADAI